MVVDETFRIAWLVSMAGSRLRPWLRPDSTSRTPLTQLDIAITRRPASVSDAVNVPDRALTGCSTAHETATAQLPSDPGAL